jgi:hypothetical protein
MTFGRMNGSGINTGLVVPLTLPTLDIDDFMGNTGPDVG